MRRVMWIVIALLVAAPAAAQQAVVQKYRAQYPTPMSKAQTLELLRSVAGELHAGVLVKTSGDTCGGYSCDIICRSDSELYDVLRDAEGAAVPTWDRTENPRGYRCELVAPQEPPHADPAPTPTDLTPVLERLDGLAASLSALERRVRALEATPAGGSSTTTPDPALAADVKRIRELLEAVAKRFGVR